MISGEGRRGKHFFLVLHHLGVLARIRRESTAMEGSVVPKRVGKKPTKPAVPSTVTTPPSWPAEVLAFLKGRQERGALADCALPELFGEARRCAPTLTIG